jgi:quaternary ammonium compound-resistance protein SugE
LRTAATQGASPQQIPQLKIATNGGIRRVWRGFNKNSGRNTMRQYAWAILALAGVFETGFSIGLKYSQGFTRLWPSVAIAIMIVLSLGLVGVATRSLPMGTAYAVWTGIGAVGTVLLGIVLFGESAALSRLACLGLIVAGIVGLKFLGT